MLEDTDGGARLMTSTTMLLIMHGSTDVIWSMDWIGQEDYLSAEWCAGAACAVPDGRGAVRPPGGPREGVQVPGALHQVWGLHPAGSRAAHVHRRHRGEPLEMHAQHGVLMKWLWVTPACRHVLLHCSGSLTWRQKTLWLSVRPLSIPIRGSAEGPACSLCACDLASRLHSALGHLSGCPIWAC